MCALSFIQWAGYRCQYSDWLRAERSGYRTPVRARFTAPTPPMGRTVCAEPQCLYMCALYFRFVSFSYIKVVCSDTVKCPRFIYSGINYGSPDSQTTYSYNQRAHVGLHA